MNADRHAELRAVAVEGWDFRASTVLGLLDEIAELRRGLTRVQDGDGMTDDDALAVAYIDGWLHVPDGPRFIAGATLARADAIGGGE